MPTAIELLADALEEAGFEVGDVLIPEQCLLFYMGEHVFHVVLHHGN